ncbi:hypothetical protein FKZ61_022030 [Litorilinea aerophila]|uniref:Uncharacterized protein n=1 Tax=Litorilinea aerophila TaxID=1204385 RepID=A0A540V986_9CHLR|nr:hypothetical protein [Litorilinea aerophila]MCC9078777.1 hypothetical protein [Litorilinea aerophila]OUC05990.1 hypothetical protein RY27_23800 [Litorilinea aerophila]
MKIPLEFSWTSPQIGPADALDLPENDAILKLFDIDQYFLGLQPQITQMTRIPQMASVQKWLFE